MGYQVLPQLYTTFQWGETILNAVLSDGTWVVADSYRETPRPDSQKSLRTGSKQTAIAVDLLDCRSPSHTTKKSGF